MNLNQRNDEQPIRIRELPVVTEPPEDLNDLSPDVEFEETSFSKWTLLSPLWMTIFTTLWAGAYQAYNGPIHGPVNFLLDILRHSGAGFLLPPRF